MIAAEVMACSACGHPVKEKNGRWRHTNTMDGHTFTTVHCQECIAAGKECAEPSWSEEARVISEYLMKPPKKEQEEHFLICKICGTYAKSKAALMRHFRDEHPLDSNELLSMQREGKSIEEMAAVLERTPQTVKYHLEKLSGTESTVSQNVKMETGSSHDQKFTSRISELENENAELRIKIQDLEAQINATTYKKEGWTRVFHLESSGTGAQEGVQAVRNAIKSSLPYHPDSISLDVESNKVEHTTRIFVEVRKK